MVALVVHRPLGVALVHPRRHRGEVLTGARLVAERPHHHARVVLVALDGALDAVQVRGAPAGVVAGAPLPAHLLEAVRLEIALQDHPEAELVHQLEHARMRRIVARADRVDVRALHELEVGHDLGLVEDAAEIRMPLVPVDAVEHHAAAVDQEPVALDDDGSKTQSQRHRLGGARHGGVVEARRLGRPRLDAWDLHRRDVARGVPGHGQVELRHPERQRVRGLVGDDLGDDPPRAGRAGLVVRAVERGAQPHVLDAAGGPRLEGHVAEDAGEPPLVLVLEVARGRPLVHAHDDEVAPRTDGRRDVELLHEPASRADADLDAVDPHAVARLDPVEAQQHASGIRPRLRQLERAPMIARRVLVGHERRVDRERVLLVRVDRMPVRAVALEHPVRRHADDVPARVVVVLSGDVVGLLAVGEEAVVAGFAGSAGQQAEPPVAVQREPRRVGAEPGARGRAGSRAGGEVREVGHVT